VTKIDLQFFAKYVQMLLIKILELSAYPSALLRLGFFVNDWGKTELMTGIS